MFYHLYDGKVCTCDMSCKSAPWIHQITYTLNSRVEGNLKMNCMSVLVPWSRCLSWSQTGWRFSWIVSFPLFFSRNTLNPRLSYAIRENVQGGVQYTYFPRKGQTFVSCARKRKSWLGDFNSKLATWSSVDFRAPLPDAVKTVLDEGISLFRLHQNRHGRYEAVSLLIYNSEPYLNTFYRQEISR